MEQEIRKRLMALKDMVIEAYFKARGCDWQQTYNELQGIKVEAEAICALVNKAHLEGLKP